MGLNWTPDRDATLIRLRTDGFSAGEIAHELGDGITRNAVLGRAHRLKLPSTKPAPSAKPPRPRHRIRQRPALPIEPTCPPEADCEPIGLIDLTATTCRWPVTDAAPWLFCGRGTADLPSGRPYCRTHRRRAQRVPGGRT